MQQFRLPIFFPWLGGMIHPGFHEQLEQLKIHPVEQENHLNPNLHFFGSTMLIFQCVEGAIEG